MNFMQNKEAYIKQLEKTIKKFLEPIKGIPFAVAIKALTECEVLPFDLSINEHRILLNKLAKAAKLAGKMAAQKGIFTKRPNEAGNHIEPFVLEALKKVGLKADKPVSKGGKRKSAGYPDIYIEDENGKIIYMDCKTYHSETKDQSFRTFYFSPSKDPKIVKDAFHLLMSFELKVAVRARKKAFIPVAWQIYTLDKLLVQIKHEFNASNRELYVKEALLAEGKI